MYLFCYFTKIEENTKNHAQKLALLWSYVDKKARQAVTSG